ncbi:MAG: sulfatase-like hydrolase/transferase [Planctomycetota bacterium]
MRPALVLTLSVAAIVCLNGLMLSGAAAQQPNVILIMIDDAGYGDVAYQGAEFATPNIDSIAANGVRFSNAHVSAPQCGPSRAGLVTGVNQARFGFHDNAGNLALPPEQRVPTIGEQMQDLGYTTGVIGKWHVERDGQAALNVNQINQNERSRPWRRGFDYTLIHDRGMSHFFPYSQAGQDWMTTRGREYRLTEVVEGASTPVLREDFQGDDYLTDLFSEQAVSFIDRHKDGEDPFFLYLSYNAPHTPLDVITDDLENVPEEITGNRRRVAAMMAATDRGIGEVQAKLAAEGIADDTMIIFLSDNGGPLNPADAYDNGIYRGVKGNMYEGGTRVPMAMQWTNGGITAGGQTVASPVSALDILPTVVAAGGGTANAVTDGVDMLPYLTGQTSAAPRDELLIQWRNDSSFRRGDDKLVNVNGIAPELYNLANDPAEATQLNNPTLQAELQAEIDAFTATQRNSIATTPVQVGDQQATAYYSFQEVAGSTVADRGFNSIATDLEIPATGIDLSAPGIRGSGIGFDGSTGVALTGGAPEEWKPEGDFTATLWVNLSETPEIQERIIDSTNSNDAISNARGWRLQVNNNTAAGALKLQLQANDDTPGGQISQTFGDLRDLTPGQWAFVAVRYDADGDASVTLLYDSDAVDTATVIAETQSVAAIGNLAYGANAIPRLGSRQLGDGKYLNGSLDEVFLYDWALTDEQIAAAFHFTFASSGDFNGDGVVDAADYTVWRDTLGSTTDFRADADGNQLIDAQDYLAWRSNFGANNNANPPGNAQATPEPSSAVGVTTLLLAASWTQRRRRPQAVRELEGAGAGWLSTNRLGGGYADGR